MKWFINKGLIYLSASMISFGYVSVAVADDVLESKPSLMWLSDDVNVSVFGDGEYEARVRFGAKNGA